MSNKIKIIAYEKGKAPVVFDSVTEAAKHYGVDRGNIQHCLAGKLKALKGKTIRFEKMEDIDKALEEVGE
jgi:hypothetical protein